VIKKFTYVHLQFQKILSVGITPDPMMKGREKRGGEGKEARKGGEGREGREQRKGWDGVNPPKTNPGYGPV
jgi:hypothetical protein